MYDYKRTYRVSTLDLPAAFLLYVPNLGSLITYASVRIQVQVQVRLPSALDKKHGSWEASQKKVI